MQLIIQYSNLLTFGNILAVITGIGSVITAVTLVYWRMRLLWTKQHIAYLAEVGELLDAHTKTIENCIHRLPGHPENAPNVVPSPDNSPKLQGES